MNVEKNETRGALTPMQTLNEEFTTDGKFSDSSSTPFPEQQMFFSSELEGKRQYENKEKLINYTDTGRRSSRMLKYPPPKKRQTAGSINLGSAGILNPLGRKQASFPPKGIPKRVETAFHVSNQKKRFQALGSAVFEHNDLVLKLLECPITKEIFREPCTLVSDGWTYEKGALLAWFQFGFDISPATGENLYGITAFAECKITSKLLSTLKLPSPFQPVGLKRLAWERYQELTSS